VHSIGFQRFSQKCIDHLIRDFSFSAFQCFSFFPPRITRMGDGYPKRRPRLGSTQAQLIHQLKTRGHSNREIARRVDVCERAIRKSLRRLGWKKPERQACLALVELGPAFYGLRTSLLTLLLMALWRIKRLEGVEEVKRP
jgi:hypothetical protein